MADFFDKLNPAQLGRAFPFPHPLSPYWLFFQRFLKGYHVEAAKVKKGPFIDSDHYGIILGKNLKDQYVTWELHLLDEESVSVYWDHYIMDREEALRDYNARGVEAPQKFLVTVTETFQLTIGIEAESKQKAEQIVSTDWRKREFVLGPECFAGVSFEAVPIINAIPEE